MITPNPFDPLLDAIADRVWTRLQVKFAEKEDIQLLSIPKAAKRLGVCKTKVHAMISSGEIPDRVIKRIGRRVLIVSGELDRWISAQ